MVQGVADRSETRVEADRKPFRIRYPSQRLFPPDLYVRVRSPLPPANHLVLRERLVQVPQRPSLPLRAYPMVRASQRLDVPRHQGAVQERGATAPQDHEE